MKARTVTNVTKPFLPDFELFSEFLKQIWTRGQLTNQGQEVLSLEAELKDYLDVSDINVVSNGTLALQLALKTLPRNSEVITTPFSYVATLNSILWEGLVPVFVDIDADSLTINAKNIENAITPNTSAILGVHVFGIPCDIDAIELIAEEHDLKIIYDAAHCFGSKYHGNSIFSFGDFSTVSFHATKLFHTLEGGAVFCRRKSDSQLIRRLATFGHVGDEYFEAGINAKMNEVSAAMGRCVLRSMEEIAASRREVALRYSELLAGEKAIRLVIEGPRFESSNYSYFPIVFSSEKQLLKTLEYLFQNDIRPRRYFYPSLNTLHYVDYRSCPVSEDIAKRILCLPIYPGLELSVVDVVAQLIIESLR